MSWPVINPLSRYRNAQKLEKGPNPPAFSIGMKEKHDTYWKTEAAMIEGNPMLLLERGEKVPMPPALWVQGRPDIVHDYHDDDFDFPGQRARAVRVELSQGRGRYRDRLCPQRRALDERCVRSYRRVLPEAPAVIEIDLNWVPVPLPSRERDRSVLWEERAIADQAAKPIIV